MSNINNVTICTSVDLNFNELVSLKRANDVLKEMRKMYETETYISMEEFIEKINLYAADLEFVEDIINITKRDIQILEGFL